MFHFQDVSGMAVDTPEVRPPTKETPCSESVHDEILLMRQEALQGTDLLNTEHSGLFLLLPPCICQFAQVHCLWGDDCSHCFNVQNFLAEIDCFDEARYPIDLVRLNSI